MWSALLVGPTYTSLFGGPLQVNPLIIKWVPSESGHRALPGDLRPEINNHLYTAPLETLQMFIGCVGPAAFLEKTNNIMNVGNITWQDHRPWICRGLINCAKVH